MSSATCRPFLSPQYIKSFQAKLEYTTQNNDCITYIIHTTISCYMTHIHIWSRVYVQHQTIQNRCDEPYQPTPSVHFIQRLFYILGLKMSAIITKHLIACMDIDQRIASCNEWSMPSTHTSGLFGMRLNPCKWYYITLRTIEHNR